MEQVGVLFKAQTELKGLIDAVKGLDSFSGAAENTGKAVESLSAKSKEYLPNVDQETKKIIKTLEGFKKESPESFAKVEKTFEGFKKRVTAGSTTGAVEVAPKAPQLSPELKSTIAELEEFESKGSRAFREIKSKFEEFQKSGKSATDSQRKELKKLIEDYEKFARFKMTDAQIVQRLSLEKIDAAAKEAQSPEEKKTLKDLASAMRRTPISRIEREAIKEIKKNVSQKTEPEPKVQPGQEPKQSRGWGGRLAAAAGGMIVGGSLMAVAMQSVRYWSDVNTELTKVQQRFDGMGRGLDTWGEKFGYMKKESIELSRAWSEITNTFDKADASQFLGFARTNDVRPEQAFQLRMAGRYVEQGGSREFLTKFEKLSKEMGMDKGRIAELISTTAEMSRIAASQKFGATSGDVAGVQRFAATLWSQAGDKERGIGQRGAEFTARLNQAISNPGDDAKNAFMLRAVGYGTKPGMTLWEAQTKIQEGAYGGNLESVLKQLDKEAPGNDDFKKMMLSGLFEKQLNNLEINPIIDQYNDPEKRAALFKKYEGMNTEKTLTDFEALGAKTLSAGEVVKVQLEKMQVESAQQFAPLINEVVGNLPSIASGVIGIVGQVADVVKSLKPIEKIGNFFGGDETEKGMVGQVDDNFKTVGEITSFDFSTLTADDIDKGVTRAGKATEDFLRENIAGSWLDFTGGIERAVGKKKPEITPKETPIEGIPPLLAMDTKPSEWKVPGFELPILPETSKVERKKEVEAANKEDRVIPKNESWLMTLSQIAEFLSRIESNTQNLKEIKYETQGIRVEPDQGLGYRVESHREGY